MSLYIFDTDTVTLFQSGNAQIERRRQALPFDLVAVSVISVEELLSGWYALLRRPQTIEQQARVYGLMAETLTFLARLPIVSMDEPAIRRFEQLRAMRLNVGSPDLRIAAIALELGATVVTRNLRDFRRVPGLAVEDWSQPMDTA